jgi:hypothetical protein
MKEPTPAVEVAPLKRRHGLARCRSGDDLKAALAQEGIDLLELLQTEVRPTAPFGLLAAGSLAEGFGTPASDVDLLMLVEDVSCVSPRRQVVTVGTQWSKDFVLYRNGIEFDIEVFDWSRTQALVAAFLSLGPALYRPWDLGEVPIIPWNGIQFLHRLRSGWTLAGEEIVARWRDELLVPLLPTYLAALRFVSHKELLEDAFAVRDGPEGAVGQVGRLSAEQAVWSLLAFRGHTLQEPKWLVHMLDRLRGEDGQRRARARRLLFPRPNMTAPEVDRYLDDLAGFGDELLEVYRPDEPLTRGLEGVLRRIHYTSPKS